MGGIIISIIGAVVIAVSTLIVSNPNSDFSLNSKAYVPKEVTVPKKSPTKAPAPPAPKTTPKPTSAPKPPSHEPEIPTKAPTKAPTSAPKPPSHEPDPTPIKTPVPTKWNPAPTAYYVPTPTPTPWTMAPTSHIPTPTVAPTIYKPPSHEPDIPISTPTPTPWTMAPTSHIPTPTPVCAQSGESCSGKSCCNSSETCLTTPYGKVCTRQGSCTPGSTKCGDDGGKSYVYTCNSSGYYDKTDRCDGGCSGGSCRANVCTPNSTRCSSNELETCASDGTGWKGEYCPYGCSGSSCNPKPTPTLTPTPTLRPTPTPILTKSDLFCGSYSETGVALNTSSYRAANIPLAKECPSGFSCDRKTAECVPIAVTSVPPANPGSDCSKDSDCQSGYCEYIVDGSSCATSRNINCIVSYQRCSAVSELEQKIEEYNNDPLSPLKEDVAYLMSDAALEDQTAAGVVIVDLLTLGSVRTTVDSSNRLFYQSGMTAAEAEAYRSNVFNPQRLQDAFVVGSSAVETAALVTSPWINPNTVAGKPVSSTFNQVRGNSLSADDLLFSSSLKRNGVQDLIDEFRDAQALDPRGVADDFFPSNSGTNSPVSRDYNREFLDAIKAKNAQDVNIPQPSNKSSFTENVALYGEPVGKGAYGSTYVNRDTGTLTKIFHESDMSSLQQRALYKEYGGQAPLLSYRGDVPNGFQQDYISNSVSLKTYINSGGTFTQEEVKEATLELLQTQAITGEAHGDLFRPKGAVKDWDKNYGGLHPSNTLVQTLEGGGHRIVPVDYGGYHDLSYHEYGLFNYSPEFMQIELKSFEEGLNKFVR